MTPRIARLLSTAGVWALVWTLSGSTAWAGCPACHKDMASGFSPAHGFAADNCTPCHAGNAEAEVLPAAHEGLRAFPGVMGNAQDSCGACHADKVAAVAASLMHTGAGMVRITRRDFGEAKLSDGRADLSHLGHSPADSLLRKQCASCHLGQSKETHSLDPTHDRGGGCLACHIDHYSAGTHPTLTATVSDARCFGCHSRSGRISLSYAGLAEISGDSDLHLEDGRSVEARPADVHYTAGLACTDCHTEADVMGVGNTATHKAAAVDIACSDCHANQTPRITTQDWPAQYRPLLAKVPFAVTADTRFLVTAKHGTPLWNIELRADGPWLHLKRGGAPRAIPPYATASHPMENEHRRLSCAACHSQWAPQCYGCHLSYDPNGEQWDHAARAVTPGAWIEQRGTTHNTLPPLGVDGQNRIVPVVPGMIMTAEHPTWSQPRFLRRFAALSPHTTGPARGCESCHRSSPALGLGQGGLTREEHGWRFMPDERPLADGLPADAWTRLSAPEQATGDPGARPFSATELRRILDAQAIGP